jgi:hypothetical protein
MGTVATRRGEIAVGAPGNPGHYGRGWTLNVADRHRGSAPKQAMVLNRRNPAPRTRGGRLPGRDYPGFGHDVRAVIEHRSPTRSATCLWPPLLNYGPRLARSLEVFAREGYYPRDPRSGRTGPLSSHIRVATDYSERSSREMEAELRPRRWPRQAQSPWSCAPSMRITTALLRDHPQMQGHRAGLPGPAPTQPPPSRRFGCGRAKRGCVRARLQREPRQIGVRGSMPSTCGRPVPRPRSAHRAAARRLDRAVRARHLRRVARGRSRWGVSPPRPRSPARGAEDCRADLTSGVEVAMSA